MIQLIIGAFVGAVFSLVIAEAYHRRASRSLKEKIDRLEELNKSMAESLNFLEEMSLKIGEDANIARKHSAAGTLDDPDYPYK